MATYPKPDFKLFFKTLAGVSLFLIVLHWVPDLVIWIHSHFFGETLVIDMRRYRAILVVAYIMAGVSLALHLSGLLWATWHDRRRKS